jgi:hypothetical protein
MFENRLKYAVLATHLRERRNEIIHRGREYHDGEVIAFQVKQLIEPIMRFVIVNPLKFSNIRELWDFLDLQGNDEKISVLREQLRALSRFRGEGRGRRRSG